MQLCAFSFGDVWHAITHPKESAENLINEIDNATKIKKKTEATIASLEQTKREAEEKVVAITQTINDIAQMGTVLTSDIIKVVNATTSTVNTIKNDDVPTIESLVQKLEKTKISFTTEMLSNPKLFMEQIADPILHTKSMIDVITKIIANISDDTVQVGTFIKDLGRYLQDFSIANDAKKETQNVYNTLRKIRNHIKQVQDFEKEADIIIPQVLDDVEAVLTELSSTIQLIVQKGLMTASKIEKNVKHALKETINYEQLNYELPPMSSIKMMTIQGL